MGQKTHPFGLRVGYIKNWRSRWFAKKHSDYIHLLHEDLKIRNFIKENWKHAGVSEIEIERSAKKLRVTIHTARPGVIIGRRGAEIDRMRDEITDLTKSEVFIDIKEIKLPQLDAQLVAENIALQLEKRVSFRRAMKRAVQWTLSKGGQGIKVQCAGRLGGTEIARTEGYKQGKVPLNTFRADIDYGFAEAFTTYGTIGVKVWIYKGDVLVKKKEAEQAQELRRRERVTVEKPSETGREEGKGQPSTVETERAIPSAEQTPQESVKAEENKARGSEESA